MDNLSSKELAFSYKFNGNRDDIPKGEEQNPATVFLVDGNLSIKIDNVLYFSEDIALFEFYLYLDRWMNELSLQLEKNYNYFSIEVEEEDPIISFQYYNSLGRIRSIWETEAMNTVFNASYLTKKLKDLHQKLGEDIKTAYDLNLDVFRKKPPIRKESN
jgi:hypothetical protein